MNCTPKYGIFEVNLGNVPDAALVAYCAEFELDGKRTTVPAFRNGENEHLVRFMPEEAGRWRYAIRLGGRVVTGEFLCTESTGDCHGPVHAVGHHFRYADGHAYLPFGTTCYAWTHQPEALQRQTLESLEASPFNKVRMCLFPKHMPYNQNDPDHYPFHKDAAGQWDVQSPDELYWQNLENRISQLAMLGIQADLILFHPYDRWGFADMGHERDMAYLAYALARLSCHHNVWWSLANEYDLVVSKDYADWDAFGALIAARDPYHHPIANHNCLPLYPKRDWMTHCSIQSGDIDSVIRWRQAYDLPVLIDECGYEGDLEYGWGNLSAREMTHRFWWTVARGGHCTHGETFEQPDEVLWWAKGGVLHGESPARIAFLREVMEDIGEVLSPVTAFMGFDPNGNQQAEDEKSTLPGGFARALGRLTEETRSRTILSLLPITLCGQNHQLSYYGRACPSHASLSLPEDGRYRVEIIDTWNMTRQVWAQEAGSSLRVTLPGTEGMAVLVTRISGAPLRSEA